MGKKGVQLDVYLSENKISSSREKAKREIISGWVKVNGETIRQPSRVITDNDVVKVERPGGIFVSRGGEKLHHALDFFNISVKGKVVADIGASTGGFTDCLLKRGADLVYAIDVGYGQLDYKLRKDTRVVVMERKNIRNIKRSYFSKKVDFITADLSFISILKVFYIIREVFSPAYGIILIKPQFEAMSDEQKKGVVIDKEDHKNILTRVISYLIKNGMLYRGLTFSPIRGPAGNVEFLLYFNISADPVIKSPFDDIRTSIYSIVDDAHSNFYSH